MENMIIDVKQRDLFIRGLTERLEEAKLREDSLFKENMALRDEIVKLRLKYDSDIRES
jgi:hypothetical protein